MGNCCCRIYIFLATIIQFFVDASHKNIVKKQFLSTILIVQVRLAAKAQTETTIPRHRNQKSFMKLFVGGKPIALTSKCKWQGISSSENQWK